MGVARGERGAWSTIPPYVTGGNLDTKHLTKGSTLYLPVEVEGALFSIGVRLWFLLFLRAQSRLLTVVICVVQDGHAAQGDGGE